MPDAGLPHGRTRGEGVIFIVRAFLAIDFPEALLEEVATLQNELRSSQADVTWVAMENLHLTLKFLGNMEENQVQPLLEGLRNALSGKGSFLLELEGIGAFPKTTSPRVLWVGVSQGKEELVHLAHRVEQVCAGLGFSPEERAFTPHLTIGRVRSFHPLALLIKKLQGIQFSGTTTADISRVTLYQSTLSAHGPMYTILAEVPLG